MCKTRFCSRPGKPGYCYRCLHERKKKRNPYRFWFGVLRRNARRRGHYFALTFEFWVKFCDETGYLTLKGRSKNSASIDRIDPTKGYIDSNIQMLTTGDNSSKGAKKPVINPITREWEIITINPLKIDTDQPF